VMLAGYGSGRKWMGVRSEQAASGIAMSQIGSLADIGKTTSLVCLVPGMKSRCSLCSRLCPHGTAFKQNGQAAGRA
jgi:hypothetical protein